MTLAATTASPPAAADLSAVKARQQAAWSSGNYAVVGTTLQIVGETLCEAADVRTDERVLDVAAGNGNATLAAARRFAKVTSTDYVPALLDSAPAARRRRGAGHRLPRRRRREPALRRRRVRRRAVDLRRDVHARSGARGGELLRVVRPRRPHRSGQLDAARLHRTGVRHARQARAAAARRSSRRRAGARANGSRRRSGHAPPASRLSSAITSSAIARPTIGSTCSALGTGRSTRRSRPSIPPASCASRRI